MLKKTTNYQPDYWKPVRTLEEVEYREAAAAGTDTGSRLVLVNVAIDLVEIRLKTCLGVEETQGLEEAEKTWESVPRKLEDLFESSHSRTEAEGDLSLPSSIRRMLANVIAARHRVTQIFTQTQPTKY